MIVPFHSPPTLTRAQNVTHAAKASTASAKLIASSSTS